MECLAELISRVDDAGMITVFYGEDVTPEEAEAAEALITEKAGKLCEVVFVYGGQPLYHYIISAE